MRLDYIEDPPNFDSPADQAVVERVKQRRGEKGLIALDRTLLHAPPVTDGWNSFLGSIRTSTTLSPSIRETAICRVAVLNKAWYEWDSHAPILRAAEDVTEEHVTAVLKSPSDGPYNEVISPAHSAVLAYTDAMTVSVIVPDAVYTQLKEHFNEREVVEITATIAAYNCVSRFLVALDVGETNSHSGPKEGSATS